MMMGCSYFHFMVAPPLLLTLPSLLLLLLLKRPTQTFDNRCTTDS